MFNLFRQSGENSDVYNSSGSSKQSNLTLSSDLSETYDSHLGQTIKVTTAEINKILSEGEFSPPERIQLNMQGDESQINKIGGKP